MTRKMTKAQAIEVLIGAAGKWCAGSGTGIAARPSERQRGEILEAVRILWRVANKYDIDDNALRNFGFSTW